MIQELDLNNNGDELKKSIDKFPGAKVLVIGDIIMDEYIWGDVSRISPEAPVPVVQVKQETKILGGAANVINNINSLGGQSSLCGVIGDDQTGQEILKKIKDLGLTTDGIVIETDRHTSNKTRIVAHNQQVVRFDRETQKGIKNDSIESLLSFIEKTMDSLDAIVVEDYGKGVISAQLMKGLRKLTLESGIILAVDPKTDHFEYYQGIDVITPNQYEAGGFCGIEIKDEESLIQTGRQMLERLNCRSVLITRGKDGMTLFERRREIYHIPTVARKIFDVSGAGDTVISTLCLGLASGLDLKSAAIIANFAAGIVVGEVGTSVVKADELKKAINSR
ncbi:MAG: D-glycero-beta-D-manno-heptose-7-phosphate kinase [Deltaproteobacteria bacterium]|nr:D-glycero-beta-D-manno-heptose-7-phosphate kinase [Deltaproteobacteria bacterium]